MSARMTIFRLSHLAKDSVRGAFDCLPSDFIFTNAGDSASDSRIHTEIPSRIADSRNGILQPHSSNCGPVSARQPKMTRSERNKPKVAVVWIQLVYRPRLPCGACSAT